MPLLNGRSECRLCNLLNGRSECRLCNFVKVFHLNTKYFNHNSNFKCLLKKNRIIRDNVPKAIVSSIQSLPRLLLKRLYKKQTRH